MKHRIKTVEEVPLSPYEQAIEDSIDEDNIPESDPVLLAEARAAAARALAKIRGGKREGSGRKPRESRRTVVLLAPAARAKLEALARETGSLSSAAEKAIMAL